MTTDTIAHSIDVPGKARGMDQVPDPEIPAKARRRQFSAPPQGGSAGRVRPAPKERSAARSCAVRASTPPTSPEWRRQRDRGALQALAKPSGRLSCRGGGLEPSASSAKARPEALLRPLLWGCPGLTDIHHRAREPGKDVHHGEHREAEETEAVLL